MNSFYFGTNNLLTGQAAPFTGASIPTANARNVLVSTYGSGAGAISIQYPSPIFDGQWVTFYNVTGLTTGYGVPLSIDSPMPKIRAISSGNGNFWAAVYQQN